MATLADRKLDLPTMIQHVRQVVARGKATDPPAFTLILGAGASHGVIPTARQMIGLQDRDGFDAKCIPAFLHERENGAAPDSLEGCIVDYWRALADSNKDRCSLKFVDGFPADVSDAYKFIFSQDHTGALNSPGDAREYLRYVAMGSEGRLRLNGTHFFLGSLLSLQYRTPEQKGAAGRPLYIGRRPFARTIFTTNFDPLLQVSLQLFHNLYYMTDRPELLAADGLQTDDHPSLHLFYAHGSVHRPFLANTDGEIAKLREANHSALASYLATHGVIVLGYSGWDDCLLSALRQTASFRHNLYWLARGEASISDPVKEFLLGNANARWVPITDAGDFMAALHRELCPGVAMTELLANPIAPLRERIGRVDLAGIAASTGEPSTANASSSAKPTTPEDLRIQVVGLLEKMERQFTEPSADDALLELQKLLHQADLAYANGDVSRAGELFDQAAEYPQLPPAMLAQALMGRGRCHFESGRPTEAIADLTRMIELPAMPAGYVGTALLNRAIYLARVGRGVEAIADYTRVIDFPGAPSNFIARACMDRGNLSLDAGLNAEAIADYTRVIDLLGAQSDQGTMALVNRGNAFQQAGRLPEAVEDWTYVSRLPGVSSAALAMALCQLGIYHAINGDSAQAIAAFTRAIELPDAPPSMVGKALEARGSEHERAGRFGEAAEDYARVVQLAGARAEDVDAARSRLQAFIAHLQSHDAQAGDSPQTPAPEAK